MDATRRVASVTAAVRITMRPTTVELTSKPVKLGITISAIAFWVGLYLTFVNHGSADRAAWGIALTVLGTGGYIACKAARWWTNG